MARGGEDNAAVAVAEGVTLFNQHLGLANNHRVLITVEVGETAADCFGNAGALAVAGAAADDLNAAAHLGGDDGFRGVVEGFDGALFEEADEFFSQERELIGGIDMNTNSWWRGYEDSSSTVLTWDALNAMWYDTKKMGDQDAPTVIFCAPGVLEAYENSLNKRVATGASGTGYFAGTQFTNDMTSTRRTSMGGWDAFYFKNIPMIEDPYATAKNAFMVNENYVNWRVLKGFESTGWQQLKSQGQDQVQLTINGYGALTFSALQKMGRFSNISEAQTSVVLTKHYQ